LAVHPDALFRPLLPVMVRINDCNRCMGTCPGWGTYFARYEVVFGAVNIPIVANDRAFCLLTSEAKLRHIGMQRR